MTEKQPPTDPVPLAALHPGEQGTILTIGCRGPLKRKLMDMGLTPGTKVYFRGISSPRRSHHCQHKGISPRLAAQRGCRSVDESESVVPIEPQRGPGLGHGRRGMGGMGRRFRRRRQGRC